MGVVSQGVGGKGCDCTVAQGFYIVSVPRRWLRWSLYPRGRPLSSQPWLPDHMQEAPSPGLSDTKPGRSVKNPHGRHLPTLPCAWSQAALECLSLDWFSWPGHSKCTREGRRGTRWPALHRLPAGPTTAANRSGESCSNFRPLE